MFALLGLEASAQQNSLTDRVKKTPDTITQRAKIDLETEPAGEPVDKFEVDEFLLQRKDLEGEIVELEFDRVLDLKQIEAGYSARISFENKRNERADVTLLIPKTGFEFFEKLAEDRNVSRKSVYVEVLKGNNVRALGTHFSKSKPAGERFSW
jgi:hypothetical protein